MHALLERPAALDPAVREKFAPKYAEWQSILHAGFSLLLHGFGSKKELLEDFASGLEKHDAPVVVLQGYAAGVRVRDEFVDFAEACASLGAAYGLHDVAWRQPPPEVSGFAPVVDGAAFVRVLDDYGALSSTPAKEDAHISLSTPHESPPFP